MDLFKEDFDKQFRELSLKYRGLKAEDLERMNPSYSCVICKKFKECGRIGRSCEESIPATEDEFSLNYDF